MSAFSFRRDGSAAGRFRLAVVLLMMCAALVGGKLLEESMVERLGRDCGSLFADRLIPATMLFHLSDQMHLKQRVLQRYLEGDAEVDAGKVRYELGQHDARLAMITEQFLKTYLVGDESRHLQDFRKALAAYQAAERRLLERKAAGEDVHYGAEMRAAFDVVRASLLSLTELQQTVGEDLQDDAVASASGIRSMLYLQLGIAFVLGLLASGLAMSLRTPTNPKPPPTSDLH